MHYGIPNHYREMQPKLYAGQNSIRLVPNIQDVTLSYPGNKRIISFLMVMEILAGKSYTTNGINFRICKVPKTIPPRRYKSQIPRSISMGALEFGS